MSPVIGTMLMVVITLMLAAMIILLFHLPDLRWENARTPEIFIITRIEGTDEITGQMNYDSRVFLYHNGSQNYKNSNLKAVFYRDGEPVSGVISTMNGDDFISTVHSGVQWMGGSGCSGALWTPAEIICIDFSNGTFHPGESIRLDVLDKTSGMIVSRHEFRYV